MLIAAMVILIISRGILNQPINPKIILIERAFETIEMSASQNLSKALLNNNYAKEIKPKENYLKRVLFAKEKIIANVSKRNFIYDIPKKNAVIEEGEPIATVIAKENIKSIIDIVYQEMCKVYSSS